MIYNKLLKFILCVVLSALLSMHISKCIFIGPSINQISIPGFLLMIIAIIKEKRKLYFLSFFIMAFMAMMTLESPDDLAPVVLLFIAMLYSGNQKTLMLCMASIPSGFMVNYFIADYIDFFNLPIGIIGNAGILLFLYFAVIRQPSNIDHLSKVTPLSKRQLLILKYLAIGVSRKEMPGKIKDQELWKYDIDKFSFHIINSEIADIKTLLDIESEFELGIWYNKKTEISRKPSKS